MKSLWRLLIVFLLLVPALVFFAVSTEPGTRSLLTSVSLLGPVEIEYGSGTLSGPLHLNRLHYESGDLRLTLDDVVAEGAMDCFWRGAVCFRQLQVRHLDLAVSADSQPPDVDALDVEPAQLVTFPLSIEAVSLAVNATRIHWSGGEWRSGPIHGRVRLVESRIEVLDAVMNQTSLVLAEVEDETTPPGPRSFPAIDLPLALSVAELKLIDPRWSFSGSDYRQDSISLAGRWRRSLMRITQLEISDSARGQVSLHAALDFSGDWPLQAIAEVELAEPLLGLSVLGRDIAVEATGSLKSLALELSSLGTVNVSAQGEFNVLDPVVPFTAALTAISSDSVPLADIEGIPKNLADGKLDFPVVASASGSLVAQEFAVEAAGSGFSGYDTLQLSLQGRHEAGEITIEGLSAVDSSGTSKLQVSGTLSLAQKVQWSLAMRSSGFALPHFNENLHGRLAGSLSLSGSATGEDWNVAVSKVDVHGEVNGRPATIRGFAGLNSSLQLAHSDVKAGINGAQFSLRTSGDAQSLVHLELVVDDLSRWSPAYAGQVQLQAAVSNDRQHIDISGGAHQVKWAGLSVEDATLAGTFQADADQSFTFQSRLDQLVWNNLTLSAVELSAQGDAGGQAASLATRGDVQGKLTLVGTAFGKLWRGELSPARLKTPYGDWELTEPVGIAWAADSKQLSLATHCWQHQEAKVCPQDWLLGEQGRGSLQATAGLALMSGLLPTGMSLDGDAQLQLNAQWNPEAGVSLDGRSIVRGLSFTQQFWEEESLSAEWDEGEANFQYSNNDLQLDGGLQASGREVVGVKLRASQDGTKPLTGSVSFDEFQLAALTLFVSEISTVGGDVSGQLALSGTLEQPLGHGLLSLSGGHLTLMGNPTELNNLDLALEVKGDWAQVQGTGMLGGGELQVAGQLKTLPDYRLELTIKGEDHTLLYPPSMELQVSENVQLVVAADVMALTGQVTVLSGDFEIEQLPEGSVAVSSSVVEVDQEGNALTEKLPFDVSMNIQLRVLKHLRISGSTINVTLGGDLRLQQQPGRPLQLFGQLNTIGGEVRAYQQSLVVRRGTLSFSGPPANPNIDVRAERQIAGSDVSVGMRVQGPLEEDLLLDIYSIPVMSQADAISYLVRGRPADTGAGADGTALALSLASGVVNRSSLVSELNRIPGISRVEFGAQEIEDDTAATVSGYVGSRIYLSYGFGLYEPVNVLTARLYLNARLWFEVVSSLENSADLYYSFDIK